jgi:hypothetical protein
MSVAEDVSEATEGYSKQEAARVDFDLVEASIESLSDAHQDLATSYWALSDMALLNETSRVSNAKLSTIARPSHHALAL